MFQQSSNNGGSVPVVPSEDEITQDEEDEKYVGKALYLKSPYYTSSKKVVDEAVEEVHDDDKGANIYYIENFLEYLLIRHLAYLPMLNRTFVTQEVNPVTLLLTNNYVEKWFSLVWVHNCTKLYLLEGLVSEIIPVNPPLGQEHCVS